MNGRSHCASMSMLLGILLAMCGSLSRAIGQSAPTQQQQKLSGKVAQFKPVSLEHLYWHFLALQNFLDTKAAAQEAQGKDGSKLRNVLQAKLGWSDTDYAPVRTSSVRLTGEMKDLDAQATTIRQAGPSSSGLNQLKGLTLQRETDIKSEIFFLKQNLPPDKIMAFEAFLTKFFSLANASPRPPFSAGKPAPIGQQVPAAVQP